MVLEEQEKKKQIQNNLQAKTAMLKQYKLTIDEVKSKEALIIQERDELAMRVQKYFNMAR